MNLFYVEYSITNLPPIKSWKLIFTIVLFVIYTAMSCTEDVSSSNYFCPAGDLISHASLRLLQPECPLDRAWCEENSVAQAIRAVERLAAASVGPDAMSNGVEEEDEVSHAYQNTLTGIANIS